MSRVRTSSPAPTHRQPSWPVRVVLVGPSSRHHRVDGFDPGRRVLADTDAAVSPPAPRSARAPGHRDRVVGHDHRNGRVRTRGHRRARRACVRQPPGRRRRAPGPPTSGSAAARRARIPPDARARRWTRPRGAADPAVHANRGHGRPLWPALRPDRRAGAVSLMLIPVLAGLEPAPVALGRGFAFLSTLHPAGHWHPAHGRGHGFGVCPRPRFHGSRATPQPADGRDRSGRTPPRRGPVAGQPRPGDGPARSALWLLARLDLPEGR